MPVPPWGCACKRGWGGLRVLEEALRVARKESSHLPRLPDLLLSLSTAPSSWIPLLLPPPQPAQLRVPQKACFLQTLRAASRSVLLNWVGQLEWVGGASEGQFPRKGLPWWVPRLASQKQGLEYSYRYYSFQRKQPGSARHPERMSREDMESLRKATWCTAGP